MASPTSAPATPGPSAPPTSTGWRKDFEDCDCPDFNGDVVLPPYELNLVAVVLFFLLSYLGRALLRRLRNKPTPSGMRGALLLASAAKPPILVYIPQSIYQLVCFAVAGSREARLREDGDVSGWDSYQGLYARWVNSGASALIITCVVTSYWMHRLLRQYVASLRAAQFGQTGEAPGEVRVADETVYTQIERNPEEKLDLLADAGLLDDSHELKATWSLNPLVCCRWCIRQGLSVMVVSLLYLPFLPALFSHIIPGFFLWVWISLPAQLMIAHLARTVVKKVDFPVLTRIVMLQLVCFCHVIVFQAMYTWAALFYMGEGYLGVIKRDWDLRQYGCYFCWTKHSVEQQFAAISFL